MTQLQPPERASMSSPLAFWQLKHLLHDQTEPTTRVAWGAVAFLLVLAACGAAPARGSEAAAAGSHQRLHMPLKVAVAGQSLRGALDMLRQASGQPYWLERRVDPDQPVAVPLAGPTVAAAFDSVAASAGLVTLPVDGLVLVGRASWIDRLGPLLMPSSGQPRGPAALAGSEAAVEWPMLTSPNEALRIVAEPLGLSSADVMLPHDLWPAVQLPPHSRAVVLTLIGAEFDLWITVDAQRQRLQARPLPESTAVVTTYPAALLTPAARKAVVHIDPQVQWTPVEGNRVQVRTIARGHQVLADQTLADRGPMARQRQPSRGAARQRFTLRLKNIPADRVLATLAAAGSWTLQIDPQADEKCAALVTLEAEDAPLADLVEQVVQQLGLSAEVRGSVLHVALP